MASPPLPGQNRDEKVDPEARRLVRSCSILALFLGLFLAVPFLALKACLRTTTTDLTHSSRFIGIVGKCIETMDGVFAASSSEGVIDLWPKPTEETIDRRDGWFVPAGSTIVVDEVIEAQYFEGTLYEFYGDLSIPDHPTFRVNVALLLNYDWKWNMKGAPLNPDHLVFCADSKSPKTAPTQAVTNEG